MFDTGSDSSRVRRLLRAAMPHHPLDLTLRPSPLLLLAAALVALAVFFVHDAPPVSAQQTPITVNSGCTLAQAINEANGATEDVGGCAPGTDGAGAEGHDTIVLTGDVTLTGHLPNIASHITIEGNGFTIDGDDKYRPFEIYQNVALTPKDITLTLNDMTLTRGRSRQGQGGGVIRMIGPWNISRGPTVTLNAVTVSNSGTIYSVSGQPDWGRPGGGVLCKFGSLNINDSVFSGNSSFDGGGAVSADDCNLTVTRSAFLDNRDKGNFGGGAFFIGGGARTTITNSTFHNNNGGGNASALYLFKGPRHGVHLNHVTITGNRHGKAVELDHNSAVLHLRNSIIYGNPGGDCARLRGRGTLATNENNIIGTPGNCGAGANGSSADPLLASSPTGDIPYFTIPQDSPAVDAAGDCASLTTEDQRGGARPQGGGCDIGAYEALGPPADFTVTPEVVRALVLAWTNPDAETTHYDVQYKTVDAPDQTATGSNPSTGWISLPDYRAGEDAAGRVSLLLGGLTPGVTYDVRVRAVNWLGDGPWATGQGTPKGNGGL